VTISGVNYLGGGGRKKGYEGEGGTERHVEAKGVRQGPTKSPGKKGAGQKRVYGTIVGRKRKQHFL